MISTIDGGLTEAIGTFTTNGDIVADPNQFDGRYAQGFRDEWEGTKTALTNAKEKLREISDNLRLINSDIQSAGGNQ